MNWYRSLTRVAGVYTVSYDQAVSIQHMELMITTAGKVMVTIVECSGRVKTYRAAITYVEPAPVEIMYLFALNEEHARLQVEAKRQGIKSIDVSV